MLIGGLILSGINRILKKDMENNIFPFFWQHGEEHTVLKDYMDKIADSGIYGVCIEARPHSQFVGAGWWDDIDCILSKAKERGMQMWILDDAHFPTGFANGRVKSDYPQYLKKYLGFRRFDVQGPMNGARVNFKLLKGRLWDIEDTEKEIKGVYMAKRVSQEVGDNDAIDPDSVIDISELFECEKRLLKVDIPKGAYSIFVVYVTREEGEETTKDYLNPLIKEATEVLINEVYEPHYNHYKDEFGKTIRGFFSDEPRFGNIKGTEGSIGRPDMVLPWSDTLMGELKFEEKYLPLLWVSAKDKEREIRLKYMDVITKLYNENFTKVLADWCETHKVMYLGHTIEDNGAHARLGYGTGHFFRGQQDMHMAGIDVIGGQVVPGMNYHHDAFSTGGSNGEFYHYALAKLGTSAAQLDPKKRGRTMCEAFGAYGWNEGLKMMKWIADHLMVRGVNYIVPHAFDPKEFPDPDCPPHFYAHGHNPQFRYMKVLNDYMNRVTNLFKEGVQPSKVGVYYPAETEWMGRYMPIEKPARELTNHQISFDIISIDYLKSAVIGKGSYSINEKHFEVLVLPYGENISDELVRVIQKMSCVGVKVIFIDAYPERVVNFIENGYQKAFDGTNKNFMITDLKELGMLLSEYKDIQMNNICKDLVVGKYQLDNRMIYMFFNESLGDSVETSVKFDDHGKVYRYDAMEDSIYNLTSHDGEYRIYLEPYVSCIFIVTKDELLEETEEKFNILDFLPDDSWSEVELDKEWIVSFGDSFSYPECNEKIFVNKPCLISNVEGWDNACGTARFTTDISFKEVDNVVIDLGEVYEIAEVFVNGQSSGKKISKPYRFDLSDSVVSGKNTLTIEVTNTLGTKMRDTISHYLVIEPFGIEDAVKIYFR